jgi:hypothetical protein
MTFEPPFRWLQIRGVISSLTATVGAALRGGHATTRFYKRTFLVGGGLAARSACAATGDVPDRRGDGIQRK